MTKIKPQTIFATAAIAVLIMNSWLAGLYEGYEYGITEVSGFSIAGESGNEFLVRCYLTICFFLITFIVGTFIKSQVMLRIVSLISLSLIIVTFLFVYLQKRFYFSNVGEVTPILRISISADLIGFLIVVGLIIGQVAMAIRMLRLGVSGSTGADGSE